MTMLEFDEIKSRRAFQKREWLKNYVFISDLWVEGARAQFEQDKKLVEELQAKLERVIAQRNDYIRNWHDCDEDAAAVIYERDKQLKEEK